MNRTVIGALCAVAALLTVSPVSSAAVLPNQAPATGAYANAMLREAVTVGLSFWYSRGFTPVTPDVMVYDEPADVRTGMPYADARGAENGSTIWFDRQYRNRAWHFFNSSHDPLGLRREMLADVCRVATHEIGHTLGDATLRLWPLDADGHAPWGIMAEAHTARVPECSRWARAKLPRRK